SGREQEMHGGGVGPYWTPISPSAGSFFHADTHADV
ncbi:hypothetical protein HNR01_000956, partial [Methylorubrum rhodesianum]|nr:hypothetical protein [Methylorubrum rhodesianum]